MLDDLEQLDRLRDLPAGVVYPSHGPALPDGRAKLGEYIRHRELRERKILEALEGAGAGMLEVVRRAYADVPPESHPIADRNTWAIRIKLVREGRGSGSTTGTSWSSPERR